jgi:putative Holliday junction resolvase
MNPEQPSRGGRIMGLDFGSKTVGVAVSDALLLTAQGVEIIRRKSENKLRRTLARIEELAGQYQVTEIVLGLPRNMNYTVGDRALRTVEFREMLIRRTGLPVILWDERLTTVAADRLMMETGIRRENRKEYVDEIAAMLILQGYLDRLSSGQPLPGTDPEALLKACRLRAAESSGEENGPEAPREEYEPEAPAEEAPREKYEPVTPAEEAPLEENEPEVRRE